MEPSQIGELFQKQARSGKAGVTESTQFFDCQGPKRTQHSILSVGKCASAAATTL